MEKRLLLVFALTFLLLLAVQPWLMKHFGKSAAPAQTKEQVQQPAPASVGPAAPPAAAVAPPVKGVVQAKAESETVVENDFYRIIFTNRGAQVKSWILKKFKDDKGRPLELVNSIGAEKYGYPMSLWTYDEGLRTKLNSALYVASATGTQRAPASLAFEYSDGSTVVRKNFQFDHSYVVKVETSTTDKGQPVQAFLAWPAGFGDQTVPVSYAASKIETQLGDKIQRLDSKKVSGGATLSGPFNWAGAADQYFAAVFLPDNPEALRLITLHNEIEIPKNLDKPDPADMQKVPVLGAAAGNASGPTSGRWFIGPKKVDVVDAIYATPVHGQSSAPNLGGLVDFGFFGIIAKPLFLWLKWTVLDAPVKIPNWGWAIVFQTVIINLALLPLRVSSMKSALKMQKVQPQVEAIKSRYKNLKMNDPKRTEMNQEIAALFKKHKVNPAGGCLPLLIQMPFLFAYYTMLGAAIELRQAPWLWIRDLSAPDPLHIMPILIIVSTLVMQMMTPTAGMDPNQRRMMNIMMPVMLGIFSWSVAAGLGLYWLLSTVISIIQQWVMNHTELGKEMQAEQAKRARKKAGTVKAVRS
ncbi:MAG: membrane protein insertase YidC [Terriglobales bacterium]